MVLSDRKEFLFVGVSTSKSAVNSLFQDWLNVIDAKADLVCIDIPVDANSKEYQKAMKFMEKDTFAGALITTHKARMYDLLSGEIRCTESAKGLREVSSVYKNNGLLIGDALDPISINILLKRMLSFSGWLNNSKEVFIFGGGGAAVALIFSLATYNFGAAKIHISEKNLSRQNFLKHSLFKSHPFSSIDITVYDAALNDELLRSAPRGSLIVNASGVGKDREGSLFQSCEQLPDESIVWEFNYRGKNLLSDEAEQWKEQKRLFIEDGWNYFVNGWAQHIGHAFHREMTAPIINEFLKIANLKKDAVGGRVELMACKRLINPIFTV